MTEPSNNPVVWVTGAAGLIGNYVVRSSAAPTGVQIVGLARSELDLLDTAAVERRFHTDFPSLVIHCAAISTAAACAKQPEMARRINVEATRQLADLCSGARLILLSTDLVFDGCKGNFVETDEVNPLNLYAETKVEAEQIVLSNPRNTVIRTSLNAGISPTGDRSFAEQMRAAWQRGESLKLFTDEFRNPIGADVTARAIWEIAQSNAAGIFHVAGAEKLSRLQVGQLLAMQWSELDCRMEPASLRDFPGPPRAADTTLNCVKAQSLLGYPLPCFSNWLREGELAKP